MLLDQVCLVGGADNEGQRSDAWLLDVGQPGWSRRASADLPAARAWHSAYLLSPEQVLHTLLILCLLWAPMSV